MMDDLKRGLPPIVAADTRLLILGSLPGDRSIAASQYYAHPRNQFWQLIGEVIDVPLSAMEYSARLDMLRQYRIGLWDVVANAERRGSLDSAMRNIASNPLISFVESLPALKAIAFNGRLAYATGVAMLPTFKQIAMIALPSSSPAHAVGIARKREAWIALRQLLTR